MSRTDPCNLVQKKNSCMRDEQNNEKTKLYERAVGRHGNLNQKWHENKTWIKFGDEKQIILLHFFIISIFSSPVRSTEELMSSPVRRCRHPMLTFRLSPM